MTHYELHRSSFLKSNLIDRMKLRGVLGEALQHTSFLSGNLRRSTTRGLKGTRKKKKKRGIRENEGIERESRRSRPEWKAGRNKEERRSKGSSGCLPSSAL